MLTKFLNLLETQVDKAIYVWGGTGECLTDQSDPEGWIRKKEASSTSPEKNARRAIALFQERLYQGMDDCRAFDCSGLVSWALMELGLRTKRADCDGLWARCEPLSQPQNGALLFRVNQSNPEDETHVGVYTDGYAIHSKGRDAGVVKEIYKSSYWHKCGWYTDLPTTETPVAAVQAPSGEGRDLSVQTPLMRGNDVKDVQKRLLALGIDIGTRGADGIYGSRTADGVAELQARAQSIRITGVADERTRGLLGL